ncbi:tail fiber assembly protein [Pseudomonas argentinensis]|uniref:tail fiber assembly protein n=1 Tax=Phytopseudomonas argentinensis TaxID=289370 RepID=UPI0008A95818|nr:tail fiber assembly protein [Pseudomonas argentinensis]
MSRFYSPSTGLFYIAGLHTDIPADANPISAELFAQVVNDRPAEKIVVTDADGMPALADPPPPNTEQLAASATATRSHKLEEAAKEIAPLQDAVDVGMATAAEQAKLNAWKVYRVLLSRIEQQPSYPHIIAWPSSPAN